MSIPFISSMYCLTSLWDLFQTAFPILLSVFDVIIFPIFVLIVQPHPPKITIITPPKRTANKLRNSVTPAETIRVMLECTVLIQFQIQSNSLSYMTTLHMFL